MRGGFFMAGRVANEKISTNKHKGKKFSRRQAKVHTNQ